MAAIEREGRRDEVYEALKAFGHSPAKAAEIALDARRGDLFSSQYVEMVLRIGARS